MRDGEIIELISWTFYIAGLILIYNYSSWQLASGVLLFVWSAKIDILHRLKKL